MYRLTSERFREYKTCKECIFFYKGRCLVRIKDSYLCRLRIKELKPTFWFVLIEDKEVKGIKVWNDEYKGVWAKKWHSPNPNPRYSARYLAYVLYEIGKHLGIEERGKYLIYDKRASSILHYYLVERLIGGYIAGQALMRLADSSSIAILLVCPLFDEIVKIVRKKRRIRLRELYEIRRKFEKAIACRIRELIKEGQLKGNLERNL